MTKQLRQLDAEELEYLSTCIDADADKIAQSLFPNQPEGRLDVTARIGQWAIHQKVVLESTAEDKPHIALIYNKICHRIWQRLPDYARCVKVRIE